MSRKHKAVVNPIDVAMPLHAQPLKDGTILMESLKVRAEDRKPCN